MEPVPSKYWAVKLFLAVFTVLCVITIEFLDSNQKLFLKDNLQTRAKESLSIIRSELEAAIVSDIYVANSLPILASINPNYGFDDWEAHAENVVREADHIRLIGMAPDDVIRYIYPLKGNERALGLDYKTIPAQWETIKKARSLNEIFIAGPVELVQGGRALVARMPIFTDPPLNTQYWGVCSVVIDLESLFSEVGINRFVYKYELAIKGTNSNARNGDVFFGEQKTFDEGFAFEYVNFPYGGWVLAASEKQDLLKQVEWYRVNIIRLIGYPSAIVLSLIFAIMFRLYVVATQRSLHDELTQLPNRRYFMYTLEQYFNSASKVGSKDSFAILNIDINRFKAINDQYGHAAGDKVLIACAQRIKRILRSSDVVARMGGDEFLVILPRVSKSQDVELVKRELENAICSTPVVYDTALISFSVSAGYSIYHKGFKAIDQLLQVADEKMYEEKMHKNHC